MATDGNDGLTVTTTDLEVGIRHSLRGAQIMQEGEVILAPLFLNILRECEEPDVSIRTEDKAIVVVVGQARFELPVYPANEYPDLAETDWVGKPYHEIQAVDLRRMIHRVMFAVGDEGAKFTMKCVMWEAEGRVARLVSTDAKVLAIAEAPATLHGEASTIKSPLIPEKAVKLLERNLTDDSELVLVQLSATGATFQTDRVMIHTRLLEGRFPPYRNVLAATRKQTTTKIQLPALEFLGKVRQAAVMAKDEARRIELKFTVGLLELGVAGSEHGSSQVEMAIQGYDAVPCKFGIDPEYMKQYLRTAGKVESVGLEMGSPSSPLLFTCGDDYQVVISPMVTPETPASPATRKAAA